MNHFYKILVNNCIAFYIILVSLYDKFTVNLYIKIYREKKSFKQIKIVTVFALHDTNMGTVHGKNLKLKE